MAKSTEPTPPSRSFTVRVPHPLYDEIGNLANAEGVPLNVKVNQLLRLGLGEHVSLDAALARLIRKEVIQ